MHDFLDQEGIAGENGSKLRKALDEFDTYIVANPSLIPNPTVNYTSPNPTGSLTFTPATNSFGTATLTVVVKDNGGTANACPRCSQDRRQQCARS